MLNMIKMDVYRMFRTKSMYVIWIILMASSLLTSFLSKIDYDAVNKEWEQQQAVESNKEQLSQQNADNVNIGMSVELPTEPGKKVTVMDVFFSNAQGKFYALFLVICWKVMLFLLVLMMMLQREFWRRIRRLDKY